MNLKIAFISDAWRPQINGVVTTVENTCKTLKNEGAKILLITPDQFHTIPCPSYPSIKLSIFCYGKVAKLLSNFKPDRIHIATEGPLGIAARKYCLKHRLNFTTSFHTMFAEYINLRFGFPVSWGYQLLKWFHKPASRIMIATPEVEKNLMSRSFNKNQFVRWSRGVDSDLFKPRDKDYLTYPRPISMYVGRVAVEKNIEAFLDLSISGTKVVVGDGPSLQKLKKQFPAVIFVGFQTGETLAKTMAAADVLVFPSLTDTFGIVMLDALACGVPVAAFPVQGPLDLLTENLTGCMKENLAEAYYGALKLKSEECRQNALNYSWEKCSRQFLNNLVPVF